MSTSLFSAGSAAFQDPIVACTREEPLQGAPKRLPPWCRRSRVNGRHRPAARAGVGQVLPRVHAPAILRSGGVVVASVCLGFPRSAERSGGSR